MTTLVYKRCHFVVHEIIRVEAACKALVKHDFATFGKLMYETHDGLSKEYGVSCKELDVLVDIARPNNDVLGARMMGGGFGGCTINLVKKGGADKFIDSIKKEYLKQTNLHPEIYRVAIADGAGKINLS
jgi:galactokinase